LSENKQVLLLNLGLTDYDEALELQLRCEAARKQNRIPDLLILLEHPPVYTLGRGFREEHLLLDRADLDRRGVKVREIRRGGDITFHGPGQLVGYPILDLGLHGRDVHLYLRLLERFLIETLRGFGLQGYTIQGQTGVWCRGGKIASIGVGLSRWVTTHGFALNVNNDLSYFDGIVACGLHGRQAASMQTKLRRSVDIGDVKTTTANIFAETFNLQLSEITKDHLTTRLAGLGK
jgi:lipoyl(octanoyl) transferase